MPRLALYLFGPPRIEREGVAIKLDRRKGMALLAYLAVTGRSHRRDSLVNLLWPDFDSTQGRSALRRTLHALSTALGGDWLDADREEIGLVTGRDLWVDLLHFRRSLGECASHGHPRAQTCPDCVSLLAEAVNLVSGEFLSGFSLRDSLNFDDWQLFQAEAVRQELAEALERLVDWHSTQREFEAAMIYARRRLALDPLDEAAHRQIMCLYAWSGRRPAALRQYDECAALLNDQLGVPPQAATQHLYKEIQVGRAPPLPAAPGLVGGLPPFLKGEQRVDGAVFVARERELAQLDGYLGAVLEGRGQVVFVTGDPGSGKTSLTQEFSRRAMEARAGGQGSSPRPGPGHGAQGVVVAVGNCNAYTGIGDPYLPFREILELMTGDVEARWAAGAMTPEHARRLWHMLPLAARTLVEAGPDLIDTFVSRAALLARARTYAPEGADWLTSLDQRGERSATNPGLAGLQQSDLFEQYTRVLQLLARQVPLLLVVDDLQWADLGSISLLFHLGRRLGGSRILIVGAYRPEEVSAGRDGERHPLEPVVNEFQRIFGDITVDLEQTESRGFLEAFLQSEPNQLGPSFREMLFRQTRAHPLFTVELLRGLQERGDLVRNPAGQWVEGAALNWQTLPARVEAAIRERIGRLPGPLLAALQVASVEGEIFTAEVITRVLEIDERAMVQCLSSELDRKHRLVRAETIAHLGSRRVSRYRFRNYLFQKYLYDSLDQIERTYLHEGVANVLETFYGDRAGEIAVQLAWQFEEAGMPEKAIHYLHQAGEKAVRLSAYQEGIGHLTRALALLATLPDCPERARQELELRLAFGYASQALGRFTPEAGKAYARARELGRQTGQTAQLAQALDEVACFHYVRAELARAQELAEEALSLAQRANDPPLTAWSHWHLGFVLFGLGDFFMARHHLGQVIAFHRGEQGFRQNPRFPMANAGLSALAYMASCLWCLGYPEQALRHSDEALTAARELGHPLTLADVLCYGGCLFDAMRRDGPALKHHADELMSLATEVLPSWRDEAMWYGGDALAMLGQLPEGIALMREGIASHRHEAMRCYLTGALGTLAAAEAKAGRPREGLTTLTEALALVEDTGERQWEAELHRLRAGLLLMVGDEAEAELCLHQAIDVARRQSARSWELRATTSLARLWQAQGGIGEARQALGQIYDWFTEGFDTPDLVQARALLEELS